MKKRTRNKLLAIATAILLAAIMVVPGISVLKVNATPIRYSPTARAVGSDENTEFSKNLQIRNDCNIPASTFSFEIVPGAAQPASTSTLAVIPGIIKGLKLTSKIGGTATTVTATKTTDVSADIVYVAQDKSGTIGDDVTIVETFPDANHYTATKVMELDFTGVEFTEPGVYRYYITESGTNMGVSNDEDPRTLDVYVEDTAETVTGSDPLIYKLKIAGYVLYVGQITEGPSNNTDQATNTVDDTKKLEDGRTNKQTNDREVVGATKSVGFINKYPTASLTFGKEVTGNQGSRDKYFDYTLKLTGPLNAILEVNREKADISISENPNSATTCIKSDVTNPSTITLDTVDPDDATKGTAEVHFYLQDGQYITINGFAKGMKYELKEEREDYKQIKGISDSESSIDYDTSHSGNDELNEGTYNVSTGVISGTFEVPQGETEVKSIYTGFTNDKTGVIPTGVILSVAPWAIAGVVILAGVVFFAIRSRKKYEEE